MFLTLFLALLVTFSPFIIVLTILAAYDAVKKYYVMRKRSLTAQAKSRMLQDINKFKNVSNLLIKALKDRRLSGKPTPIMVPDKKKIKEMEQKGVKIDDTNRPMKPLEDDGGRTIMEYKCEKWDPRFDQFSDGSSSPIVSRIYLKPDPMAMTKRRPYAIILSISYIISVILLTIKLYMPLLVPIILSIIVLVLMFKRGKECLDSENRVWDKLKAIYDKRIKTVDPTVDIRSLIRVNDWNALGDDQYESNARTFAAERGMTMDLERILPKINPKTLKKSKPKRAVFRDVPSSITIQLEPGWGLDPTSRQNLIDALNLNLGGGKVEWVAKKPVPQKDGTIRQVDGWDFDNLTADFMTLPPLPVRAALPEDIDETPWNIIRLGKTVDGEAVWDLSGQGWGLLPRRDKEGKIVRQSDGTPEFPTKKDPDAQPDIIHYSPVAGITCPMGLVPLDENTLIFKVKNQEEFNKEQNKDSQGE